jgi:hypothetical protein
MLPDVHALALTRLGLNEYPYRSVRWFRAEGSSRAGVERAVDEPDPRPRHWLPAHRGRRLGVETVVTDPSAGFRKARRIGLSP